MLTVRKVGLVLKCLNTTNKSQSSEEKVEESDDRMLDSPGILHGGKLPELLTRAPWSLHPYEEIPYVGLFSLQMVMTVSPSGYYLCLYLSPLHLLPRPPPLAMSSSSFIWTDTTRPYSLHVQ